MCDDRTLPSPARLPLWITPDDLHRSAPPRMPRLHRYRGLTAGTPNRPAPAGCWTGRRPCRQEPYDEHVGRVRQVGADRGSRGRRARHSTETVRRSTAPRERAPTGTFVLVETLSPVVREGGVEPPRPCGHWNLNPARLPIPPPAHLGVATSGPTFSVRPPGDIRRLARRRGWVHIRCFGGPPGEQGRGRRTPPRHLGTPEAPDRPAHPHRAAPHPAHTTPPSTPHKRHRSDGNPAHPNIGAGPRPRGRRSTGAQEDRRRTHEGGREIGGTSTEAPRRHRGSTAPQDNGHGPARNDERPSPRSPRPPPPLAPAVPRVRDTVHRAPLRSIREM